NVGRNWISANCQDGIEVNGPTTKNTLIQGNYIGLDLAGKVDLGNAKTGIRVVNSGARIGSPMDGELLGGRNFISGNDGPGILLTNATNVPIFNNFIGLNSAGDGAVPNSSHGVEMRGTTNVSVGGLWGLGNTIAGNKGDGIRVSGSKVTLIQGNI